MNAELAAVEKNLFSVADSLESPLSDLVRAQIRRAQPLTRAAIVLAAGHAEADHAELEAKRVYLASALEMLYVALGIHKLLIESEATVGAGSNNQLDKTIIGSTILAGDYCFSRSAAFAAQTDSPKVVALFAAALKDVSEGHLRHAFEPQNAQFKEAALLFEAGIRAASVLTHLPKALVDQIVDASTLLAGSHNTDPGAILLLERFPRHQRERWQIVYRQLSKLAV